MPRPADLPPVTQQHRMHAYAILRPIGVSFEAAMHRPECATLRRVIECKAAQLRTDAWKAAHQAATKPVRRVRMGPDGNPTGWCTQMARGAYEPVLQPELPHVYPTTEQR